MKPKSIPAEETIFTLSPEAASIVKSMMAGGRKFFDEGKEEVAAVVAVPEFGDPRVFPALHSNPAEKQIVWSFLRLLRATHPVVALINEAWYSEYGKDWDPSKYVPPSQDPNRKELMLIYLWDCERSVVFHAQITRNPNHLGEWRTVHDSDFPLDNGDLSFSGALMEGEKYKRSIN